MVLKRWLVVAITAMCFVSPRSSAQASDALPKLQSGFDVNAMDKSIDPCVDFYHYACGTWLKENPVPPDKSAYGRFTELADRNRAILKDVLGKASVPNASRSANEQKIGDYYASCMDENGIEEKGTAPLAPELERISALKNKTSLTPLLAHYSLIGVNAFFGFGVEQDAKDSTQQIAVVGQGGLGLPDRDFYFRDDPKSVEIRRQYVRHMQRMFQLFGENEADAAADAQTTMQMETALARNSLDNVSRRDPNKVYHRMSLKDLQALGSSFSWNQFMQEVGLAQISSLNVAEPEFVQEMEKLVATTSLDDIKVYLRGHVISAQTQFLPKNIYDESFDFYNRTLSGQKEPEVRWKRCVISTDGDLGEALGQAFVERAFGAEGKERTLQMVNAIEKSLEQDISSLPWMTASHQTRSPGQTARDHQQDRLSRQMARLHGAADRSRRRAGQFPARQ